MEYKHKTLGNFSVSIAGIPVLSMDMQNYAEQMDHAIELIKQSITVEFKKTDGDFTDLKRAAYKNVSALVMLAPGMELVMFQGSRASDEEALTRYATEQLRDALERDIIQFAKQHLDELRSEARTSYLSYARNKLLETQDQVKRMQFALNDGLQHVNSRLVRPKMGLIEGKLIKQEPVRELETA